MLILWRNYMFMADTNQQFAEVMKMCRSLFEKKLHDYGAAWRIMRPQSITDQIYIKANRIRSLQMKGTSMIDEGEVSEFIGIVNYSIIGLIQLHKGVADKEDMTPAEALAEYDSNVKEVYELMVRKNHDYDEAWRMMRIASYTDLILMKVFRTKQIEELQGATLVSEGVDANYMDMLNYAVFALIKLKLEGEEQKS